MLPRLALTSRLRLSSLAIRGFSMSRSSWAEAAASSKAKKFVSPKELMKQKKAEAEENKQFQEKLLQEDFAFESQIVPGNNVDEATQRPVPLNVELLQYKPMKIEPTHGHKVVELRFKGYDETSLVRASEFAARAAFFLGIPCSSVQKLKTEKRLYTVIRSPFAQAKSKENFHRVTHNRLLTAFDTNPEVVDLWLSYVNKHALEKVEYSAQMYTREPLDFAAKLDQLEAKDMAMPDAYGAMEDPIAQKVQELLKSDAFKTFMEESK